MPTAPVSATTTRGEPFLSQLAYATVLAALAVLAGSVLERALGFRDQSLLFLAAVVFAAVRTRLSVSVYAAVLCFLAYDFFFFHPRYSLYIAAGQGVATVAIFLLAALVCGQLASRLHEQVLLLGAAKARTEALQSLGQQLTGAVDEADVGRIATAQLSAALDGDAAFLSYDEARRRLGPAQTHPGVIEVDRITRTTAEACLDGIADVDAGRPTRLDFGWWCFPLAAGDRALGAVLFRFADPLPSIPPDIAGLAQAMARGIAQALARTRLAGELESARFAAETERLRAALLSSVSHDLRSPLSTIIGSAESLRLYQDQLSREDRATLAGDILDEGLRLDRYIQNLLDMTRLEHGGLAIGRDWVGLDELFGMVLPRLRRQFPGLAVTLQLPSPPPLLHVQPALVEQAFFNILENGAKFSPPGEGLVVVAAREGERWRIDVADRGPGIAEADRGRVFERFYSVERGDRRPAGTGLGLTICQGIVAAHGGSVEALAGEDGVGTRLRVWLPAAEPPAGLAREDAE